MERGTGRPGEEEPGEEEQSLEPWVGGGSERRRRRDERNEDGFRCSVAGFIVAVGEGGWK